ncbi:leucine-rich repeat protein, partial [Skeletonema marinoi]
MEPRDYNYYEANAADISLEDITSSKRNAQLLRRLCDGDWRSCAKELTLGRVGGWATHFHIGEGDDLGWLGYFIGNSEYLRALNIHYLPEDERGEQQIDAFMDGLARNQSIRTLGLNSLGDYGSTATLRVLGNLTQLEKIVIHNNNLDHNGCSALGTLLQSGFSKLEMLHLQFTNIDDDGVAALAIGLRSIGPSLKTLGLPDNSIGNEGLSTLVAALESCTSLERLDLSHNDFSLAAVGLRTLSDWLQTVVLNLDGLYLQGCDINDEGLQAFAEGA